MRADILKRSQGGRDPDPMRTALLVLSALLAVSCAPALAAGYPTIVATNQRLAAGGREVETDVYSPATTTVAPGAVLRFVNADGYMDGGSPHTLTATDGASFDTGIVVAGYDALFTAPDSAGLFPFGCTLHPAMRGLLRVE